MTNKKGRPKIQEGTEKSRLLAFRLSEKDLLKLKEISVSSKQDISTLIRESLKKNSLL